MKDMEPESEYVIACTPGVEQILLSARAEADAAAEPAVRDTDLLAAFIKEGGGTAGEILRAAGITLEALGSRMYGEDGYLLRERFDELAWHILDQAVECARQKGHCVVGRRHLIHAMLSQPASSLAGLAEGERQDPESLAGMLYSGMPAAPALSSAVELKAGDLARDLLRVLCAAEAAARDAGEDAVSEPLLFRALSLDGGGEAGVFLQRCGVKWHPRHGADRR
jgi:ATP-dependent Clp protease ATP-binding subunit ClpA